MEQKFTPDQYQNLPILQILAALHLFLRSNQNKNLIVTLEK